MKERLNLVVVKIIVYPAGILKGGFYDIRKVGKEDIGVGR